ncbi:ACT domain-containing protein [Alicyclobacillus sp. ALC3]|uniref:ACT domain-containing protein n=1 Tax=Alicyclobacillus sp. ALC3 TaxID=2796143 RepID=UPI002379C2E0|nr:ACT domain-containing protein [Alicyclobacillus sp. ALC3]WDL98543.1 ACT domain-containing protein [Alicyclobacillus sp. ALC3]
MENEMDNPYYLIRQSHLPDGMRKTVEVMELLKQQPEMSVLTASKMVGISRSVFYKYKNVVKPFYSREQAYIITISLMLRHTPGVLSKVLDTLSRDNANILTINQSLPLQGIASVTISLDTSHMDFEIGLSIEKLNGISGVENILLVGQG